MSVKFKGNFNRVDRAIKKALNPTSVEFAKKANKYVKKDTGATESSVWALVTLIRGKLSGIQIMLLMLTILALHLGNITQTQSKGGEKLQSHVTWKILEELLKMLLRRIFDGYIFSSF